MEPDHEPAGCGAGSLRGADAGPRPMLDALPTLWTGILYDRAALEAAWDLCRDWPLESHERLRADVTRLGLKAKIGSRTVQDVARDMVAIARQGLKIVQGARFWHILDTCRIQTSNL